MKRKQLYPTASIIWFLFCLIVGLIIFNIIYPDFFKSKKVIYYEPDTEETK